MTDKLLYRMLALVLVLVVLMAFIGKLFHDQDQDNKDKMCRSSVRTMELLHIKGAQLDPQELKCPTKEVEITAKRESDIKKAIAEEMVTCWDNFHQGTPELFEKPQVYCSVCAILDFKQETKIKDFSTYLGKTKYNEVTYMDYLMNYETSNAGTYIQDSEVQKIDDKVIDTSNDYSIIFVYVKGTSTIQGWMRETGKGTLSTIVGVGTGAMVGGIIFMATPSGWITTLIAGSAALVTGGYSSLDTYFSGEEAHVAMILLREHTGESFKELRCDYYPSVQGDPK
ncbi:MAG: hypothetical protein ACQESG_02800 [Nanobdellota archaeon]